MENIPGYRLKGFLGAGEHSVVFLAEQEVNGNAAAVKVLSREAYRNPLLRRRMLREAGVTSSLAHERIINVLEWFETDFSTAVALEYVDGRSLGHTMAWFGGPLPFRTARHLFDQLLEAVTHAHNHRVIHGNLKPSKVLVTTDNTVKLGGFRFSGEERASRLSADSTGGVLRYMAPENVLNPLEVHPGTDVYSLGMMLYEMLTGRLPFETGGGNTELDITQKIVFPSFRGPETYNPSISEALSETVMKALAAKSENRYRSCAEFREALHGVDGWGKGERENG